jgi:L-amino acid N-acyltransferase YncA
MARTFNRDDVVIRPILAGDLPRIQEILSHYVQNTVTTFKTGDTKFEDVRKHWIDLQQHNYPFLVAIDKGDKDRVVGYINAHIYNPRPAYQQTAEMTLLVDPEYLYGGVGTKLMTALLWHLARPGNVSFRDQSVNQDSAQCEVKQLISVMAVDILGKGAGLGLRDWYVGFGMREVGVLKEVGYKFDRLIDVIILQMKVEHVSK